MEKSGKGLLNRSQQDKVSAQNGLFIEDVSDSNIIFSVSAETVQLEYFTAGGTKTTDAGEAAGTVVVGKLANDRVLSSLGDKIGHKSDTSLSFTSTALTTLVEFPYLTAEKYDEMRLKDKAEAITKGFSNGQYCIDHVKGVVYGKKASTATTLTSTAYKIQKTSVSATLVTGDIEIGAVEIKDASSDDRVNVITQNAAFGTATKGLSLFGKYQATPTTYDDNDAVPIRMDPQGAIYVKDTSTGTDVAKVTATGTGAISTSTAIAAEWKLLQVIVHFSSAPTTSQNLTMTLDSVTGAAYDTVLYSVNPSLSSATDLVYTPDNYMKFYTGDELVIAFTNTDGRTFGLTIYYQLI